MANLGRKSPALMTRVLALHREKASAREIALEVGLNASTITRWLKDAGLTPNGGHGPKASRQRATTPGDAATAPQGSNARLAAMAEEVLAIAAVDDAGGGLTGYDAVSRRLALFQRTVTDFYPAMMKGEIAPSIYTAICTLELRYAAEASQLAPMVPLDPEKDPTNQEAGAAVVDKLRRLVEAAEAELVCVNCGGHPQRKVTR